MKQFIERVDMRAREYKEAAQEDVLRGLALHPRLLIDYTVKAACECVGCSKQRNKEERIALVKEMIENLYKSLDESHNADPTLKSYIEKSEAQYLYNDYCLYFKLDA